MKAVVAIGPEEEAGLRLRYPLAFRPAGHSRAVALAVVLGMAALYAFAVWRLDFSILRVINGLGRLGGIIAVMLPPDPGNDLWLYLRSLGETIAIAFLGTSLGAALAFPLGILAAKNVIPNWIFHFSIRRAFDTIRSVDILIWALIWINVVGLGPFAGVLAMASADLCAFGKLFAETVEAAERKAVEGIRSTGGGPIHEIRYGLIPQVLPVMAGQVLYYFESNTRSATILGIVGAGGIGLQLSEQIRTNEWTHVSFMVMLLLIAVAIIDTISSRLRAALMGKSAH